MQTYINWDMSVIDGVANFDVAQIIKYTGDNYEELYDFLKGRVSEPLILKEDEWDCFLVDHVDFSKPVCVADDGFESTLISEGNHIVRTSDGYFFAYKDFPEDYITQEEFFHRLVNLIKDKTEILNEIYR